MPIPPLRFVLCSLVYLRGFRRVSMNTALPGLFILSGRAYVENPRPLPGKPRSVVLDVSFLAPPERDAGKFACSFRYFKSEEAFVIADGLYDIVATVTLLLRYSPRTFPHQLFHHCSLGRRIPAQRQRAKHSDIRG